MAKKNSKPAAKPKPTPVVVKPPDSVPVKYTEHPKDDKKKK
jgi:hypothetical protein